MENAIKVRLPIAVSYPALEGVLKKQMVGEFIPKPEEGADESPYAQILEVGIAKSSTGVNDVILAVKMRVLRTVMRRDNVDLYILATLDYDNEAEELYVQKFKLESRTSSSFYNTALEVMANKVAYNQILRKTRFNLREIVLKELGKVNTLLEEGLELKGVKLLGRIEQVRIQNIAPRANRFTLVLEVQGDMKADIVDLISLMPVE